MSGNEKAIRKRFRLLSRALNERTRRLFAAAEAKAQGRGGIAAVVRATGISRATVARGLTEIEARVPLPEDRIRRPGGGRKRATELDPTLVGRLEGLVEPTTRGDPDSPLRWTCKSTRKLAEELSRRGPPVSPRIVAEILHDLDYSLGGQSQDDRGAQPPRPQRPVRAHQPQDPVAAFAAPAPHLR